MYHYHALAIQGAFRGYQSRKYNYNHARRKRYLQEVTDPAAVQCIHCNPYIQSQNFRINPCEKSDARSECEACRPAYFPKYVPEWHGSCNAQLGSCSNFV